MLVNASRSSCVGLIGAAKALDAPINNTPPKAQRPNLPLRLIMILLDRYTANPVKAKRRLCEQGRPDIKAKPNGYTPKGVSKHSAMT
ncbi:MAG: hypothetical protein JJU36_02150 [Phycisphaeraceae bacterium]|nr:hypothetical protein [Phycisphaeraceae bacterium]